MFTYIIFFDKKLLNSCYILLQYIIIHIVGAIKDDSQPDKKYFNARIRVSNLCLWLP